MLPLSVDSARTWASFAYRTWAGHVTPAPEALPDETTVRRLGIGPWLYHALQTVGDDRAARFAGEYRHATTANLIRLASGARIRDALEARGVTPVLLKGGAFLVRFSRDTLGLRPMADLDLLVPPDQYEEAQRILESHGFTAATDPSRASTRVVHASSFVSTNAPIAVDIDLHRGVAQWPIATTLARRILSTHDRVDAWRVPRIVDAFCLTSLHRARHGFVWSPLDLFELKRAAEELDRDGWRELIDSASSAGLTGSVWAGYRQAVWWLGDSPEDEAHLAQLAGHVNAIRRRLLERIAAPEGVLSSGSRWQGPVLRNLVVSPCAMTTTGRALTAAATFLPLRLVEEWRVARRQGLGATARLRRLWDCTWRGTPREAAGRLR